MTPFFLKLTSCLDRIFNTWYASISNCHIAQGIIPHMKYQIKWVNTLSSQMTPARDPKQHFWKPLGKHWVPFGRHLGAIWEAFGSLRLRRHLGGIWSQKVQPLPSETQKLHLIFNFTISC